ncbi:kinesin-like protein KIF14 [Arctopsyche grandis]|uniref:kinesin-like protein KIF14 n=1 Tax=Arctopsyche grandis TaxID=121162 RepID=UPI00406DA440
MWGPRRVEAQGAKVAQRRDSGAQRSESGALQVFVRVRPSPCQTEGNSNSSSTSTSTPTSTPAFSGSDRQLNPVSAPGTTYTFERVFWTEETQAGVFATCGQPLLQAVLNGYNACLFAYGQTGSGKTFSMMGSDPYYVGDSAGLIPRFCCELLQSVHNGNAECQIEMSYFEIYNEKIYDLLVPSSDSEKKSLRVREHPEFGPYVENLTAHHIEDFDGMKLLLNLGNSRRATAATIHNDHSSRSHSIVQLLVRKHTESALVRAKVSLVDLAGSERICHPAVNQVHYKEGLSINKSLLTLGKIINCLSDANKKHFAPYRESVLTWLLKESLGGNSFTSILATVSLDTSTSEESLATLRYACQARRIVNKVTVNEDRHHKLIYELRREVERLKSLKESSTENDNLRIIELQQTAAEERLKIEMKQLSTDLEVAERRRNELENQKKLFFENIKKNDISLYKSDFFNNLQDLLDDSHEEDTTVVNANSKNYQEMFARLIDFRKSLENLHVCCSANSDPMLFNAKILPLLVNIRKYSNEIMDVLSA